MSRKEDKAVRDAIYIARVEKKKLEDSIRESLNAFSERTDLPVDSLDITCSINTDKSGSLDRLIVYLEVTARVEI